MLKTITTRKNAFSTPSQPPTWRFRKKRKAHSSSGFMARKIILWSITSNNSSYAVQEDWEGSVSTSSPSKHLLLLLGITQQSTRCWIWWCKGWIITIQQLTLVIGRRARKGGGPSLTHRPDPTANLIRLCASAAVGPESREAEGCPSFFKRGTDESGAFSHRKNSQCMQIAPSRTSRACSSPKQKTQ